MKYGNYWDDDQVIVTKVFGGDLLPQAVFKNGNGAPAFLAVIHSAAMEYMFVEIVPKTEHEEQFLNLDTGQFEIGTCVKVNIYEGSTFKFEDMLKIADDTWPLSWFRLTKVPPLPDNPYDAWNRAFAIIGG